MSLLQFNIYNYVLSVFITIIISKSYITEIWLLSWLEGFSSYRRREFRLFQTSNFFYFSVDQNYKIFLCHAPEYESGLHCRGLVYENLFRSRFLSEKKEDIVETVEPNKVEPEATDVMKICVFEVDEEFE